MRRPLPLRVRRHVYERAARRCEYCASPEYVSPDTFSLDHVLPKTLGGSDDEGNLALSCQGCNAAKADATTGIDPLSDIAVALYNPRTDSWREHFRWSEDALHIKGLTPTGRATIARLQLNRDGVVNLRRILVAAGEEHPPKR